MLTASVLAVLGAGAWWWVTWPERTAGHFIALVNAEDLDVARRLLTKETLRLEHTLRPLAREENHRGEAWILEPLPRSLWDIVIGRQEFRKPTRSPARVIGLAPSPNTTDGWAGIVAFDPDGKLIVERGTLTTQWELAELADRTALNLQKKKLIAAIEGQQ
jgi:hypothetical protein